jgi:hypothetical protein
MNTRKALILSIPVFVVTLVVLVAVLALMFTSGPATTAPVEAERAVIMIEEPSPTDEDTADEVPAAPTVIYENQE